MLRCDLWQSTGLRLASMLLGMLGALGPVSAAEVVVVLSSASKAYIQAADAIAEHLRDGDRCRRVELSALQRGDWQGQLGEQSTVVAVGAPAASWLHEKLQDRPLISCMLRQHQKPVAGADQQRLAVSVDIGLDIQVDLIRKALPECRVVGTLVNGGEAQSVARSRAFAAALPAGMELVTVDVQAHSSTAGAIATLVAKDIDLIWTAADASVYNAAVVKALLQNSLSRRVPVYGFSHAFVQAGALLGAGIDPADQGRQVGELCNRLHRQQPVADPVPEVDVLLNQIVADKLSIRFPAEASQAADAIIGGGR